MERFPSAFWGTAVSAAHPVVTGCGEVFPY
jgi:hypothetical protein